MKGGIFFFCALAVFVLHVLLELHLKVLPGAATKLYCHHVFASGIDPTTVMFYEFEGFERLVSFQSYRHPKDGSIVIHGNMLGRTAIVKFFDKLGCVLVHSDDYLPPGVKAFQAAAVTNTARTKPQLDYYGDSSFCEPNEALSHEQVKQLQALFDADIEHGKRRHDHTRALVLLHCGKVVAESYADYLGVNASTPLLGWSMTKSLTSLLVGARLAQDSKLQLQSRLDLALDGLDEADQITLRQLINMEDGLDFEEVYGYLNDPSQMLFRSRDVAGYTRGKRIKQSKSGTSWCYHSGATNLVSDMLRLSMPSQLEYLTFPWTALFNPMNMTTAAFHIDAQGLFIGSSFGFASARDWAKLGQLRLQKGRWNGKQLIAPSFFEAFAERLPSSGQTYSGGFWHPPPRNAPENLCDCAARHREASSWMIDAIPEDAIMAQGYRDQFVVVSPVTKSVLVRLGRGWQRSQRSRFFKNVSRVMTN
eukprot:TRINITY_DN6283_c0_g1_i1.p1 TRINITY_DN6283_c0_g1~~TRINITY_DN6283_c0_g1_i1.p1  ORF type:complete len:477 (+),score=89.60 TRINITY_DN6283_c0_g1_i1:1109-2539(+)